MKITNTRLGVLAPTPVRRKRTGGPLPPWRDEVPPDTIDIELLPRINRYERGSLRFHAMGNTQRKFGERLALFRDALDIVEPGLAHSEAEMMNGLREVMEGRRHLMTERQLRTFDLRTAIAESLSEEASTTAELNLEREGEVEIENAEEQETSNLSAILDDEIGVE